MLPNLIVVGAAKAGTTSFHSYLGAHPEIFMSRQKEIGFFLRDDWQDPEAVAEYERHFTRASDERFRGESTTLYSQYPHFPDVASRMAQLVPEARLVYLVREPFERLQSAYYEQHMNVRPRSWEEFLGEWRERGDPMFCPTLYASQLKLFLRHYSPDRILVVDHADMLERRGETLREVFAWLGVDPDFTSPEFTVRRNTRRGKGIPRMPRTLWKKVVHPLSEKVPRRWREPIAGPAKRLLMREIEGAPPMDQRTRDEMAEVLAPEVAWLREFTGRRFESWSI